MMHLAYPNVIDRQFRACVRYISTLQNPVPSVYTSTSDAPPNTPNLATLRAVTHRLAPEWSTQGGYKVRLYEKADVRGTWQGASLDLAYLLASIRCVRSLRLEAFVDAGDVWCTGAIGALESGAPRLRAVAAAEFAAKLAGFVAQPHDRFFLVPAANIHTQLYELCATHDVQVLPLADFQQALPEAVAARRWAGQAVILIEEDQLQALVATLFAPPLSAAAPTDDPPTPEPMLRRPYKFLAAFAREDADLFYGRAREIRRLQSLLPMARVLILHGASGTGKTSLLQAGLLPRLPPARYAAVQVRIVDDEPTRAIKAALLRAFGMAPRSLDLPLLDVLTAATAAVGKAVVVILDQFEELFLRFPPVVRQGLQQELGACVAAPLAVHFVLALREDYLAPLAEFQDTIPTLLTHTMRLTRLPVAQAFDAVVEPARRLGITVDETLIREILLPQLADAEGRIDPPLLQLVCDALYQQAQDAEHTSIGQAEYTALGDVRAVLQDYLQAMLQQFGPDQPRVREVLKALVAADGTTRRTVFLADLLSRLLTAGVCLQAQALERLLLRRLVHRRLVRVDEVEGRARYELVHDFLVPSIAAWMTADDRTPLAAKELIEQAYEGFTRTGLLLERAALHWIAPYEGRLDLPPEQHAFLARSRRETGRQRRRLWLRVGTLLLLVGLGVGGGLSLRANRQLQQALEHGQQLNHQLQVEKAASQRRLVASYAEHGRQELLRGQPQRAAVYLSEAYQLGETGASLRVLLALALQRQGAQLASLEGEAWSWPSIAFSADGTRLVTVDRRDATEQVAKVWQASDGLFLFAMQDTPERVGDRLAAVVGPLTWVPTTSPPDDPRLVTADEDGKIQVTRGPGEQLLPSLDGSLGAIAAYRNSILAIAKANGTVEVREMFLAGSLLASFVEDPQELRALTFSPDGSHLVVVRTDGTVQIRDASTAQPLTAFADPHGLSAAAFSPDGTRLVTTSAAGTVQVWAMPGGQLLTALEGHPGPVHAAAFSPDGTRLVTTSAAGTVQVWAMPGGQLLTALEGHPGPVHAAAFSPDGTRLVTASRDRVQVWEAPRGQLLASFQGPPGAVVSAAFRPEGIHLVTVSPDGTAHVWDAVSGQLLPALQEPAARVGSAAFSPDGVRLVTTLGTKTAQVWDAASGQLLTTLSGHTDWVYAAAFSPDGTRLVTASQDGVVQVWDAASGARLTTIPAQLGWVYAAAFSPDGTRLVTASQDGVVQVWDAASGARLGSLKGHTKPVCAVAWSPDGTRLVTASADKTAQVWDIARQQPLTTLLGHTGPVCAVAWSPDGTRVVTASADKTARVWDAASGQLLTSLEGHTGWVTSAVFSPDPAGQRLVTTSRDGTAKVWDVPLETRPPAEIVALVRCRVPWRLTAEGQLLQAVPDSLACPPLAAAP